MGEEFAASALRVALAQLSSMLGYVLCGARGVCAVRSVVARLYMAVWPRGRGNDNTIVSVVGVKWQGEPYIP